MRIVAGEASHPMCGHQAGDEIVSLHPVFVRSPIAEMGESRLAEFVVFELPVIAECLARLVTHRPIVIFPLDGISWRTALRVAGNANVISCDIICSGNIHDV